MKRNLFSPVILMASSVFLLQLTACDKTPTGGTVNLDSYSYEIKDTITAPLTDSIFNFNADGTLATITDQVSKTATGFNYLDGQRENGALYDYTYDANGALSAIAWLAGQYGKDSILLFPNGKLSAYKHAIGITPQGFITYNNYTYSYGGPVSGHGPAGDPVGAIGKSSVFDASGNPAIIYTDSIRINYVSGFNAGFTPLMTICNDSRVHFSNLRLWCNIPIVTTSCIGQIKRYTHNNVVIPGKPPVITMATDNFTYEYDQQSRPVDIVKNGIPVYTISYHN